MYKFINKRVCEAQGDKCPIQLFISPDPVEIKYLIEKYQLDEHTLQSALDPDEISRLEFEPDHVAIILKRPRNYSHSDDFLFKISSIGIFLFKKQMVILMREEISIFEQEPRSPVRLEKLPDLLIKIIYGTISHFLSHLRIINQISDSLEQKIQVSMENRYLLNMFTLEKSLVYYLNGITYNTMLFEKLRANSLRIGFTTEQLDLLDDIIIENNQCCKQAEIYSNILSGLMDARASLVNNNLNQLIKRLTIISVVFLPLNFLAGMGGMSEYTMMTRFIPWWISYPLFACAMLCIGLGTYFFVSRYRFDRLISRRREMK